MTESVIQDTYIVKTFDDNPNPSLAEIDDAHRYIAHQVASICEKAGIYVTSHWHIDNTKTPTQYIYGLHFHNQEDKNKFIFWSMELVNEFNQVKRYKDKLVELTDQIKDKNDL